MAEARNAIDLYYLQKRGFHISGVEDGYYTLTISIPYPQTLYKHITVLFRRGLLSIRNRFWPVSVRGLRNFSLCVA